MAIKINFSIYDEIIEVANILEKSKFSMDKLSFAKKHITRLEKVIPVSGKGLLYFCALFRLSLNFTLNALKTTSQMVNFTSLADYLGLDVICILKDYAVFEDLFDKRLYCRKNNHETDLYSFISDHLIIPRDVFESIMRNEVVCCFIETEEDIQNKLMSSLYNLKGKSKTYLIMSMKKFERHYCMQPFIKRCNSKLFWDDARLLYYYLCMKLTWEHCKTNIIKDLFLDISDWTSIVDYITNENNPLIKKKIIEVIPAELKNDTEVKLTNYGLELFYGDKAIFHSQQKNSYSKLMDCIFIREKKLIYDEELEKQIMLFENCIEDSKYKVVKNRLQENNLPQGICALFYGDPGTGKTESVMQIARKTNRDVMHIDIAETKSSWYGESEKLMKRIFSEYKTECRNAIMANKPIPILLFNEADAVISKRKSSNTSTISQTENAIQNIILENLESFDGIMIATTNLAENFDTAFERRFLFKVKFNKATREVTSKIWKSKFDKLNQQQALELADAYEFSGGEIDNISRKIIMNEIITGQEFCFDDIKNFCFQEKLEEKADRRIGFC